MDPTLNHDGDGLPKELRQLQIAKETLVRADGIGADVPTTAMFDRDGHRIGGLVCNGLCSFHWSRVICGALAATMSDAVMVVGETYLGPCASADGALGLAERFAKGDRSVQEAVCLTVGAEQSGIASVALPYRYNGRTVEWLEPVADDNTDSLLGMGIMAGFVGRILLERRRPLPLRTVGRQFGVPWVDATGTTHFVKPRPDFCGK